MPSLQVREMPIALFTKLKERAKSEHRSIAQEAIILLEKGLNVSTSARDRRRELVASILKSKPSEYRRQDPVPYIREDRER